MSKAAFFTELKTSFFPRLRSAGFTGSGQHFCRVRGEVLQAINLQSNKDGSSCAVNLGLHLTFLPTSVHGLPVPHGIRESDCEFRRRLTTEAKSDHWCFYDDPLAPAALTNSYFSVGEPWFERYSSVAAFAAEFDAARLAAGQIPRAIFARTPVRAALAGARIHAHLGNYAESRRMAQWALTVLGPATLLQEELEQLARE